MTDRSEAFAHFETYIDLNPTRPRPLVSTRGNGLFLASYQPRPIFNGSVSAMGGHK
jgi:hypothetical protein